MRFYRIRMWKCEVFYGWLMICLRYILNHIYFFSFGIKCITFLKILRQSYGNCLTLASQYFISCILIISCVNYLYLVRIKLSKVNAFLIGVLYDNLRQLKMNYRSLYWCTYEDFNVIQIFRRISIRCIFDISSWL